MTDDAVSAVLNPRQLEEFRAVAGVGAAALEVDFTGWSKLALLTEDRVFLFPRRGREAGLRRDAMACDALQQAGVVETVLDWDTAGIGHPLHDFDFGEWGFGIFRWEADFARLREAMWDAYAARLDIAELPSAAQVHLTFTLSEFLYFERRNRQRALDAWGQTRLGRIRQALGPATEAAA